jgi:hypothetical protein
MITSRFIGLMMAAALIGVQGTAAPSSAQAEDQLVTMSLSQCYSGYFCVWSGTNYTGSIQRFSSTGSYRSINLSTVRSLYNRRSARTFLHEAADGTARYSCYGPGQRSSDLTGWRQTAEAVWLSTVTSC